MVNPGRPPTAFETRVYAACSAVPAGRVTTYGAIAVVLSSSARAVGGALSRNPFAPVVPCHRVIAAGARLGGFSGTAGDTPETRQKVAFLSSEGVRFDGVGGVCVGAGVVMGADELAARMKGAEKLKRLRTDTKEGQERDGAGR